MTTTITRQSAKSGTRNPGRQARRKQSRKSKGGKGDVDVDVDVAGIEKLVKSALGPDFEKKMEELGEKIGKEMEAKFGEDSEFAKKMEALGKEMEKKFGEDSEFAKEMEKKFGEAPSSPRRWRASARRWRRSSAPAPTSRRR